MTAYLLDISIEQRVKDEVLTAEEEEQLIKQVQENVQHTVQPWHTPVILTSLMEKRSYLRRLIRPVLPKVAVLNYQELAPDASIQTIARISWNPEKAAAAW